MSTMLSKENVRSRLQQGSGGMSFAEFTYPLLQARTAPAGPPKPVSRPSFFRVPPGMRSIHPRKCQISVDSAPRVPRAINIRVTMTASGNARLGRVSRVCCLRVALCLSAGAGLGTPFRALQLRAAGARPPARLPTRLADVCVGEGAAGAPCGAMRATRA